MKKTLAILLLMTTSVLRVSESEGADGQDRSSWPQWRGPTRDGRIEAEPWPKKLADDALRQVWRVELGPSYSGPIVSEDRVFVTETQDEKYEVVRALDRETGKELWANQWEGALSVPFFARANGDWIRATPAYDGQRLYVAGMRDVLVCLDGNTGKEVWRVDFVRELQTPVPQFGFVCSPLVVGDYLYVQAGASFAKLDKLSGEIIWRSLQDEGGMQGSAFSSPSIDNLAGADQLVVQTRSTLAGVHPESGDVLWSQDIPAFRGMNILTPTIQGDTVFTSSYGGRSFLFRVVPGTDGLQLSEVWTNKAQGYMSSPVVIDGHAYLHLRNQRFTCIHLETGETKWTTRPFGKYWSLVANGKQILALDERGQLRLIRANPDEFELIDERTVSDDAWAHLAVCDSEVFVRELRAMTVFRWTQAESLDR